MNDITNIIICLLPLLRTGCRKSITSIEKSMMLEYPEKKSCSLLTKLANLILILWKHIVKNESSNSSKNIRHLLVELYKRGGVIQPLNEAKWKEYYIDDIFTISAGKRLTKADMDVGNIPFIGATDSNNGITGWIATPNSSFDQNVLGVNYNGSVVENFYHVYGCVFSDDVKRLHLRNHSDNKFILLFCKVAILQQKGKYTYGYKFNGHRMERQKILLPVNEHGHPDYDYMERYGRKIMVQMYQRYTDYIPIR